jgi:hypothetical protein
MGMSHDGSQWIVDLVRGRSGEAGDIPEDVPFPDGRFGLLAVRDVTGDRRRPDDPPLASRIGDTVTVTSTRRPSAPTVSRRSTPSPRPTRLRIVGTAFLDDVGARSAIIATVPMKACGSTSDSS